MNIIGDSLYSVGDQLQLNCLSEGGPEIEYTWLLPGNTNITESTNALIIANVTTSDGGDYTCIVTNDAGYESYTITVLSELHTFIASHVAMYVCVCIVAIFLRFLLTKILRI